MDQSVSEILQEQEREDLAATMSDEVLRQKIEREFLNAAEVLAFFHSRSLSPRSFFTEEGLPAAWPVLPVRRAECFDIRKHTVSQRPYLHGHDFYELIYVRRGVCAQTLRSSDASVQDMILHAGQAVLLAPGAVHALKSPAADDVVLKLVLPRALYERIGADRGKLFPPTADFVVFERLSAAAERLFCKLLEENFYRRAFADRSIEGHLILLFVELLRGAAESDRKDELFSARLAEYFRDTAGKASLCGFADRLGYSAGYAGRLIREKTGDSFSAALDSWRLQCAAAMLESGDLSVEDIAFAVGYANPSGLYKRFCAVYGMPPASYRKMFR